jgi:WD40 repeat protein
MWDAATGEVVVDPFTGHTSSVKSVAFSPDGQWIASASQDCMICMWDATTGEVVVGPFTGHTDSVELVAFSLDGQRIASASQDRTIRVWDAITGEVVAGPFTGHTELVRSVALSQSEQHTVSVSGDCTIRVEVTTEDIHKIHFTDKSLINSDGWCYGSRDTCRSARPPRTNDTDKNTERSRATETIRREHVLGPSGRGVTTTWSSGAYGPH